MTIREALVRGGTVLGNNGIDNAALDTALLLAEILGLGRAALIAAGPENFPDEKFSAFEKLIERRINGECTAYILGRKEFYGLEFAVNSNVLVPRPDTETLVEAAIEEIRRILRYPRPDGKAAGAKKALRVLDLCTGSGAVAVALQNEIPELEVWAGDISAAALDVARKNAGRLLSSKGGRIHFRQGNLFAALAADCGRCPDGTPAHPLFSLIAGNPPYVPSGEIAGLAPEVQNEPHLALDGGADGLDLIRTIIADAPEYLETGGVLLLETDPRQMRDIARLLEQAGFGDVQIRRDLPGRERVIGGRLTL